MLFRKSFSAYYDYNVNKKSYEEKPTNESVTISDFS